MRIGKLFKKLRRILLKIRDAERLSLKVFETFFPAWIAYPGSLIVSPGFRLSALAVKYCKLPIDSNLVMYESYNGRDFAGNPYALFLHLINRTEYAHLEHVLVASSAFHPKVRSFRKHPRVRIVRPNSLSYVRYAETSKFFINNSSWKPYLVKRDGQVYVYTWHSTLLKKLAADKGSPWEARNVNRALVSADYFISPNRYTTDLLIKSHGAEGFINGAITEFGYPRNDLTVNSDITSLKKSLGMDSGEKLVLFAPTWRGEQFARDTVGETLEWRNKLEASLPCGYRILVKFHTMVYRFLDRKTRRLCVPLGIDANEILSVADILVTDYSGIFFDFLTTGRPIIFFTPDREEYTKIKKGFYLNLENLPGPVFNSIDDVAVAISGIDEIIKNYKNLYKEFCQLYVADDDGSVCRRTVDLVLGGKDDSRVYIRKQRKRRILLYPGPMNPNGVTTSFISLLSSFDYSLWNVAVLIPYDGKNREFQARIDTRAGIFYLGASDAFSFSEYAVHARFIKHGANHLENLPVSAYTRTMNRVFSGIQFDTAVNFHGYQPGDAARIAFGVKADKRVVFLHNDLERDRKIKQPQLRSVFSVYKFYEKLFCVSADSLKANIKGMAAYVKSEFGQELSSRMDYVRNLVDPGIIRLKSKEGFDGSIALPAAGVCSFITIGRLSPEKNHKRLIEAFLKVNQKYPETHLYVVGDGSLHSNLHHLATSLGLSDKIIFISFTANPYPLLAACDCFVLSSDIEGQPITILEALTLDKPIISTDIAGPHDLLKEGYGKLVEQNPEALAQAMIDFIDNGRKMDRLTFDAEAYVFEVRDEFKRKVLGEK